MRRATVRSLRMQGFSSKEIAMRLNTTPRTVKRDVEAIRLRSLAPEHLAAMCRESDAAFERVRQEASAELALAVASGQAKREKSLRRLVDRTISARKRLSGDV